MDENISLKKGMVCNHTYRHDLEMTIKKAKTEEGQETMIKKVLQCFLDIML